MIKQVDVKNYRLLQHCDVMVERLLKLPQTFKSVPMPNNSYHRLRQLMAVNDGRIEETNSSDYADRIGYTVNSNKTQANFNDTYPWFRPIRDYAKYKFIQYFNEELLSGSWYWDSYEVQPPKYGWTAWHNSKNKPRHFIRFIWNSGEGYTTYVENGKSIKIKDPECVSKISSIQLNNSICSLSSGQLTLAWVLILFMFSLVHSRLRSLASKRTFFFIAFMFPAKA